MMSSQVKRSPLLWLHDKLPNYTFPETKKKWFGIIIVVVIIIIIIIIIIITITMPLFNQGNTK